MRVSGFLSGGRTGGFKMGFENEVFLHGLCGALAGFIFLWMILSSVP